ncbi:aminodeoxychorismate synthase, subunit I [Cognatiyoonia sediminum]|uniref:Aminodeoxychorismate synthase, subunit I n=1 Tax=Cognatiyoonia sediminum TaxID=1508389 RepID=A0A1M5SYW4_9RHOB|nr:aminodeoxychorismate synthase component I [Cognatiyoonia sediminum]SHH43717.1 aminodeoxychorismate synthase, subunit I [Cognatiyoonia sediminum]
MTPRVLFDKGPLQMGTVFEAPVSLIRADTSDEVPAALDAMQAAKDAGHWLAGYASYELGYLFTERLRAILPENRSVPFLLFGVFERPRPDDDVAEGDATLSAPAPLWDIDTYRTAYDQVKDHVAAGDFYQANLTFPMEATLTGPPAALYRDLRERQPVPHGAMVDLGGPVVLSRSPELFFRATSEGELTTRPMKGTIARGSTIQEDVVNSSWLRRSEKNRAENLMIVDLLRNDMSRISEVGSVKVPELYTVESYATVYQMTSTIRSQMIEGTSIPQIFEALFPCGSVTGAPKIMSMTVLERLEYGPRDVYCGSIGWIAPDGAMEFNVAIRTLTCFDDGRVRLNVGGGIVHDSEGADEYDEALLKARFASL